MTPTEFDMAGAGWLKFIKGVGPERAHKPLNREEAEELFERFPDE